MKNEILDDQFHIGINNFGTQMAAPFYVLSNFFLNTVNLQTDVIRLMNQESRNKSEHGEFTLETSKISSRAYSILQQKAQANEVEEYITRLVEADLIKKEENTVYQLREEIFSEIDTLRRGFLEQIDQLKNELAHRPNIPVNQSHSHSAKQPTEKVEDMKEGQLLGNDRVVGSIKEVIDVDF